MGSEAHVRIDEGIKRGPRNKRKSVPRRRDPVTNAVVGIPPNLDAKEVLDRYLTEATTSQIAAHYGVSRKTLVAWLREVEPIAWKKVQVARALIRKEQGDEEIEGAQDALSLARAREMLKSGQWDLERLDAANYAQKQEIKHENAQPILVITVAGQAQTELAVPSQSVVIEQQNTPSQIVPNSKPLTDKEQS